MHEHLERLAPLSQPHPAGPSRPVLPPGIRAGSDLRISAADRADRCGSCPRAAARLRPLRRIDWRGASDSASRDRHLRLVRRALVATLAAISRGTSAGPRPWCQSRRSSRLRTGIAGIGCELLNLGVGTTSGNRRPLLRRGWLSVLTGPKNMNHVTTQTRRDVSPSKGIRHRKAQRWDVSRERERFRVRHETQGSI